MSDFQTSLRRWIEDRLPWFNPAVERARDRRTEVIRQRSIAARVRSEGIIDEYRRASGVADDAGEAMVDEVRRANE